MESNDLSAQAKGRWTIEATVIRADGTRQELGVIGDTSWRRFDPRRLLANRRIRKVNDTWRPS